MSNFTFFFQGNDGPQGETGPDGFTGLPVSFWWERNPWKEFEALIRLFMRSWCFCKLWFTTLASKMKMVELKMISLMIDSIEDG